MIWISGIILLFAALWATSARYRNTSSEYLLLSDIARFLLKLISITLIVITVVNAVVLGLWLVGILNKI